MNNDSCVLLETFTVQQRFQVILQTFICLHCRGEINLTDFISKRDLQKQSFTFQSERQEFVRKFSETHRKSKHIHTVTPPVSS